MNISTFCFSLSKKFLQFIVPQKFSIFTFGPFFKVNSHVEFIYLIKFCRKIYNIIRISPIQKLDFFNKRCIKYEFLYIWWLKNSYLIYVLLKNSNFFWKDFYNILHISAQFH